MSFRTAIVILMSVLFTVPAYSGDGVGGNPILSDSEVDSSSEANVDGCENQDRTIKTCVDCYGNIAAGSSIGRGPNGEELHCTVNSVGNSYTDVQNYQYTHSAQDINASGRGDFGCTSCGGGAAPKQDLEELTYKRFFKSREKHGKSSHSSGWQSNYDYMVRIEKENETTTRVYYQNPNHQREIGLFQNGNIWEDSTFTTIQHFQAFDSSEVVTTDIDDMETAEIKLRNGYKLRFEIFSDGTPDIKLGRPTAIEDRRGYGLTYTYKSYTQTELNNDPLLYWQIDTITNDHNQTLTFTWTSDPKQGYYAVKTLTKPDGNIITYNYSAGTNGEITSVDFPNGDTSTYSSTTSTKGFQEYRIDEASEEGVHRKKVVRLTNPSSVFGNSVDGGQVYSTSSCLIRYITNGDDEVTLMVNDGANTFSTRFIYEGGGVLRYAKHNVTTKCAANWTFDGTKEGHQAFTNITWENEFDDGDNGISVESMRHITPPKIKSKKGEEFDYTYYSNSSLKEKSYSDGTTEQWAYNEFNQKTIYKDRLDQVTEWEYDSLGNLTKKTVGQLYVSGDIDNNPTLTQEPEFAEYEYEYYPSGHANEHRLKFSFDANDNRTEYIYDSNQFLIEIKEPDDTGTGFHTAQTFTYDTAGRLKTSKDALNRETENYYDSLDRVWKIEYHDGSPEEVTYGTGAQVNLIVEYKDRDGNVTKNEFDNTGRLTKKTEGFGTAEAIEETYEYIDGTSLISKKTRAGNITEFEYDYRKGLIKTTAHPKAGTTLESTKTYIDNLLFSSTDPYGRSTYYLYRESDSALVRTVQGMVSSFAPTDFAAVTVDALQRDFSNNADYLITDFELDVEGRVVKTIDPRGNVYKTSYDSRNRVVETVEAFGSTIAAKTQMDYDANSNVIEVRSPRHFDEAGDFKTKYSYTRRNFLESTTEGAGTTEAATASYTYYDDGRAKDYTDFRGNTSTSLWHQCCGRIQAQIDEAGHGTIINNTFYDDKSHIIVVKKINDHSADFHDPINAKTRNEITRRFDSRHRLIAETIWLEPLDDVDPNDVPIGTDPGETRDHLTTTYEYFDEAVDGTGTAVDSKIAGLYGKLVADGISFNGTDQKGSAIIVTNPEGELRISISDGVGRAVISGIVDKTTYVPITWNTIFYDEFDGTEDLLKTKSIDALDHTVTALSDGAGRTLKTLDALSKVSTYEFDANSNRVKCRDPNGVGEDCVYDERNRDTSCTDTKGDVTERVYDHNNNVVTIEDAKNNSITTAFDARDRVSTVTDRLNGGTTYTYDDNNNVLTITDSQSKVTTYTYDTRNLHSTTTFPSHTGGNPGDSSYDKHTFFYDEARRQKQFFNQYFDNVARVFDMANRVKQKQYWDYDSGTQTWSSESTDNFTYDDASRLLTASKGRYSNTCTYEYDQASRKTSEKLTINGKDYTTTHTYDEANRETSCTYPDGSVIDKEYTDRNQVSAIDLDSTEIVNYVYDNGLRETTRNHGNGLTTTKAYNLDNTLSSISVGGKSDLSYTYTYDANKNVLTETNTGTAMSGHSWTAVFDNDDRVTSYTKTNGHSQTFALSLVGNINSTTIDSVSQTRTHNNVHEITGINGSSIAHDLRGNETAGGKHWDLMDNFLNEIGDINLQGYWDFEEASGSTAYDKSGNSLNGIHTGTTHSTNVPSVNFRNKTSIELDGTSDYVRVNSPSLPTGNFTYSAWIDPDSFSGNPRIFMSSDGSGGDEISVQLRSTGKVRVKINGISYTSTGAVTQNAWNHVAATRSGSTLTIYINGTSETITCTTATLNFNGSPLFIGCDVDSGADQSLGNYFDGHIDEARVYNSPLTAQQITDLSNGDNLNRHVTFEQDALGRRVSKTDSATGFETIFICKGQQVIAEYDASKNPSTDNPEKIYVYSGGYIDDIILTKDDVGTELYYHQDRQFNVKGITDSNGAIVELYSYSQRGERTVHNSSGTIVHTTPKVNQGYTGQYHDAELGDLVYFRARYYDTHQGGFISRDPLGMVDGASLYAGYFSAGMGVDPTGTFCLAESAAVSRAENAVANASFNADMDKWNANKQLEKDLIDHKNKWGDGSGMMSECERIAALEELLEIWRKHSQAIARAMAAVTKANAALNKAKSDLFNCLANSGRGRGGAQGGNGGVGNGGQGNGGGGSGAGGGHLGGIRNAGWGNSGSGGSSSGNTSGADFNRQIMGAMGLTLTRGALTPIAAVLGVSTDTMLNAFLNPSAESIDALLRELGINVIVGGVVAGIANKIVQRLLYSRIREATIGASRSTGTSVAPYYPSNNGAAGSWTYGRTSTGQIFDRYGGNGSFVGEVGDTISQRSLPFDVDTSQYRMFEVIKPFDFSTSRVAPAFGELGGGTQHLLPGSVEDMISDGYLREIFR